jgi:4-amino-4-deoxy-L-arabinose transferase-like glycosyltransferase
MIHSLMRRRGGQTDFSASGALASIAAVGLMLRMGWLLFGPAADPPDTAVLLETGHALVETGRMSSPLYMPGYPILLHALGGHVLGLQIALSVVTVLLVYELAERLWRDQAAALAAAAFCAVHPMLVYYANLRTTETVYIFLLLAGLVLVQRRKLLIGAVVLVLANLVRPSLDMIMPAVVALLAFAARRDWRDSLRAVGWYAGVYVLGMASWWLHNYAAYGQFVRLNLADGVTLVIENNASFASGHGTEIWGTFPQNDAIVRNDAMKRAAIEYVLANPRQWLAGCVRRLQAFLSLWPIGPVAGWQKIACAAVVLPVFLGAAGSLRLIRRQSRLLEASPFLLIIGFLTALHVATHANERYRLPLDPLLIVLASGPIALLARPLMARVVGRRATPWKTGAATAPDEGRG